MGTIQELWDVQRAFTERLLVDRGTTLEELHGDVEALGKYTRDIVLALHSETDEILQEVDWKMHSRKVEPSVRSNVVEESVDVFKYLLNIFLAWGVTPEEFEREFRAKSNVVLSRYEGERGISKMTEKGTPIVAVDIDGVLAEYPGPWLEWLSRFEPSIASVSTVEDAKDLIDPGRYEKLKTEYRTSGEKRRLPATERAADSLRLAADNGYGIVLLSARPVKRFGRIYGDTLAWLEDNDLPFDAIIFGEDKAVRAARNLPTLRFMIEDDWSQARTVARLGVPVYVVGSSESKEVPEALAGMIRQAGNVYDAMFDGLKTTYENEEDRRREAVR